MFAHRGAKTLFWIDLPNSVQLAGASRCFSIPWAQNHCQDHCGQGPSPIVMCYLLRLPKQHLFSHVGGWNSKNEVSAGLVSSNASPPGFQIAVFLLCLHS
jgi:hypothetical protein